MQNNKFLSRDKTQALIDELKVTKAEGGDFLKSLAGKGYTIEGYNDQEVAKPEQTIVERAKTGINDIIQKRTQNIDKNQEIIKQNSTALNPLKTGAEQILNVAGQTAGGIGDVVGGAISAGAKAIDGATGNIASDALKTGAGSILETDLGKRGLELAKQGAEYYDLFKRQHPEAAMNLENTVNIAGLWGGTKAAQVVAKPVIEGANVAGKTLVNSGKTLADNILANASKSKVDDAVLNLASNFLKPTAEDTTLTALAPFKANISPTTKVSVPVGKSRVMKEIGKLTEEEKQAVKGDILTKYQSYYDQGLKATTNAKEATPADLVAKSVDTAVKQTNKIRKDVGAKMGEVEQKAKDVIVDLTNTKSIQGFVDSITSNKTKAGYAGSKKLIPETKEFLKDLNTIQARGASVKEVLDFTRQWQNKLENLKDKFGGFTKDKFDLGNIQAVIKDVKNQARNTLSKVDGDYKSLVKQYRETSQLRDTANRLLGEEGLYGDTLKGASVVKRAVKSISDAGSRQFLKKLEDLTGYDGLSDAQIAIKAMQDAGDFRGLSLLEILNDASTGSGVIGTVFKAGKSFGKKILAGSENKITENFIKNAKDKKK